MYTKNLVDSLNKMYERHYGKGNSCTCENWGKCSDSQNVTELKFCFDRLKIGEEYGKNKSIPKIVFCGLEATREEKAKLPYASTVQKRIPEIDVKDKYSQPSTEAYNNHYRGVRYVLSYILAPFFGEDFPKSAKEAELKKFNDNRYMKNFCLTNIYKCAFGREKSGLTHNAEMQYFCPKIFFDEIDILEPDILVMQVVSDLPKGFWTNAKERYRGDGNPLQRAKRNTNTSVYRMFTNTNKPFLWVWTYHGNGGPYARKGNGGVFVNNQKYISEELNPVLNRVIEEAQKIVNTK